MSSNAKTIRIISFSGKSKGWRVWSRKFLAMAAKRGYREILIGKKKGDTLNEEELLKNAHAYNDLILSMVEETSFSIVDESVSEILPEGDSAMAWEKLEKRYESRTSATKVQLLKNFSSSKLKSEKKDPGAWISELEIIRSRLKKMDYQIEDKYMIIHILNNLPASYDNLVDNLEDRIDAYIDPLTVDLIREKLQSKYEKIKIKTTDGDEYDSEDEENESALAGFSKGFKARCYNCGEFGHKGSECPNKKAPTKFMGKCFHCGKIGHKKADCWLLKKELKKNSEDSKPKDLKTRDKANVVKETDNYSDDSSYTEDEISLICIEKMTKEDESSYLPETHQQTDEAFLTEDAEDGKCIVNPNERRDDIDFDGDEQLKTSKELAEYHKEK